MTYDELKKAYEEATKKCSELEKENGELKKANEDKDLRMRSCKKLIQWTVFCINR